MFPNSSFECEIWRSIIRGWPFNLFQENSGSLLPRCIRECKMESSEKIQPEFSLVPHLFKLAPSDEKYGFKIHSHCSHRDVKDVLFFIRSKSVNFLEWVIQDNTYLSAETILSVLDTAKNLNDFSHECLNGIANWL